jgi:uncharacterized membrane protein YtjA (UPF0391 family)
MVLSSGITARRREPALEVKMIRWAIGLLVVAIVAAVLGFGGIAGEAAGMAKILFFVAIVLAVLAFLFGRKRV